MFTFVRSRLERPLARALRARTLRTQAADERGIALVLYTLSMIPMLGMLALVVDMGVEFGRKTQMQAAVDAAVLAAAPVLGPDADLAEARTRAKALAAANGFPITDADISFEANNERIVINRSQTDNLFFARIFGIDTATPQVRAAAQVGTFAGGRGIVPFGIEEGELVYGETYCLKADANGPCSGSVLQGNFQALNIDVGDNGANPYRDDIIGGADEAVELGDIRNIAQGNIAGPTRQGVGCDPMPGGGPGRLSGNTQTFDDVFELIEGEDDDGSGMYRVLDWNSPRIAIVPIVSYPTPQTARVEGFAGFYLESCSGNGNSASVTGRFVQFINSAADARWIPLGGDEDYGLRSIKLVS